jgi:5-methylcytosine-specific restriction endonuclease McrA
MSTEQLLDDLRRVAKDLAAETVRRDDYEAKGRFSSGALERRFSNSWSAVLRAAGLGVSGRVHFVGDEESYFEIIEAAWQKFGRPPKKAEIRRPTWPVGGKSVARHFGSWRAALEAFVNQAERAPEEGTQIGEDVNSPSLPNEDRAPAHRTNRSIGWRLRFLVLRRDGFRCRLCGASPAITPGVQLQVDHIEPWANGGETVLENLQTTCDRCNGGKSALPLHEGVQTQEH